MKILQNRHLSPSENGGSASAGNGNQNAGQGEDAGNLGLDANEGANDAAAGQNSGADDAKIYTKADLDRHLAAARRAEEEKARKKVEEERKRAEMEKARVTGDSETVIKQLEEQIKALETERHQREVLELRQQIAADRKFDSDLLEFITGETESEITAQMDRLQRKINVKQRVNHEGGSVNSPQRKFYDEIREQAQKERAQQQGGQKSLEERLHIAKS